MTMNDGDITRASSHESAYCRAISVRRSETMSLFVTGSENVNLDEIIGVLMEQNNGLTEKGSQ